MPSPATPFLAHPYKCPGGMGVNTSILKVLLELFLLPTHFSVQKVILQTRLFSVRCALFQVPYPVSLLLAALTKTAGCIPTLPILEHFQQSRCKGPLLSALPLCAQRLCVILFRSSLLNFQL